MSHNQNTLEKNDSIYEKYPFINNWEDFNENDKELIMILERVGYLQDEKDRNEPF